MFSPADVIRDYLINDLTDASAATVASAYPTLFSGPSDVPPWDFQSLKTIFAASPSDLARRVISVQGVTATTSDQDIEIYDMSSESVEVSKGRHGDQTGAATANIRILVRTSRYNTSATIVHYASERVKWLIDHTIRNTRGSILSPLPNLPIPEGDSLPIPYGYGVDPNYYFDCFWQGTEKDKNAIQETSVYRVEYVSIYV